LVAKNDQAVTAAASAVTDLGPLNLPEHLSSVYFVNLELSDAKGKLISRNFYWQALKEHQDDLTGLNQLPITTIEANAKRHESQGKCFIEVTLQNPSANVALMVHLQLHRQDSGERVLPAYYTDNYISLTPGESRSVTIEAAISDLKGEKPLIAVDGWNIAVKQASSSDVTVTLNVDAQVDHWPETGLPIVPSTYVYVTPSADGYKVHCGGSDVDDFVADENFAGGNGGGVAKHVAVDVSAVGAGGEGLYQTERWGKSTYTFAMKPLADGHTYTVRLHFAETTFDAAGKRKFNVAINGRSVLTDFDVFQEAGGKDRALVREFPGITPNGDGKIVIGLDNGSVDQPEINAIEIKN
jgi:hypothetical protein